MKAISLWQPWASLIAMGLKTGETRGWPFPKGLLGRDLLIHAAGRRLPRLELEVLMDKLIHFGCGSLIGDDRAKYDRLPFGKIVCIVLPTQCLNTNHYFWPTGRDVDTRREKAMGNFGPDRFVTWMENIRPFKEPWPLRGRQGLFDVSDDLIAQHELAA